jgi:hypothetical protein
VNHPSYQSAGTLAAAVQKKQALNENRIWVWSQRLRIKTIPLPSRLEEEPEIMFAAGRTDIETYC